MLKIFISHSSKDVEVVKLLVDLIRSALNLKASDIRCTSIDGHRLPGGADIDEQLRTEIYESEAFVGVISSTSIESMYVSFELGARWGVKKHLLPVLLPATPSGILAGPLRGLNVLRLDSASQIHQLIEDLGKILEITPQPAASYQRYVDVILSTAANETGNHEQETIHGDSQNTEDEKDQIVVVDDDLAKDNNFHNIFETYFPKYHIKYFETPDQARKYLEHNKRIKLCIVDIIFRSGSELSGVSMVEFCYANRIRPLIITGHQLDNLSIIIKELGKLGLNKNSILKKPASISNYLKFLKRIEAIVNE